MSEIQDEAYTELCRENERLKFLLKEERKTMDELSELLLRAADALEELDSSEISLIEQLRDAAQ